MLSDKSTTAKPPKLLDQVRVKHYSIRTEQTYLDWIKRFIFFHDKTHPKNLGAADVEAFLTHLAVAGKVAASTQNQAKSALLFLYREVLEVQLPWLDNVTQAKTPKRLPVVLTIGEAQAVLSRLSGTHSLIASLLYGTGMRLMEAIRLRVKDVEFSRREIIVREGKGFKDRVTMLPQIVGASVICFERPAEQITLTPFDLIERQSHHLARLSGHFRSVRPAKWRSTVFVVKAEMDTEIPA